MSSTHGVKTPDASAWWALVMGAAASLEDAANCLCDSDAKKQAEGAAKHYREAAQKLYADPSGVSVTPAPKLNDEQIGAAWDADKAAMQHDPRTPREAFWAGALWAAAHVSGVLGTPKPEGENHG